MKRAAVVLSLWVFLGAQAAWAGPNRNTPGAGHGKKVGWNKQHGKDKQGKGKDAKRRSLRTIATVSNTGAAGRGRARMPAREMNPARR